jgi:hypothetical protein
LSVGIQFADQGVSIFLGCSREVGDEGLHGFTAGFAERFATAVVRRVALYEARIELEFADQKAKLIAESGLRLA